MRLFAAAFAAFLFQVMPVAEARLLIRNGFSPFCLVVNGTAMLLVLLLLLTGENCEWIVILALGCSDVGADPVNCRRSSAPPIAGIAITSCCSIVRRY